MENNSFLVIWLQNQFIYGFKVFVIDKESLTTTYQSIEKPQAGETLDGMIERILMEYNITDFAIKAENKMDTRGLEKLLIEKGFNKYSF